MALSATLSVHARRQKQCKLTTTEHCARQNRRQGQGREPRACSELEGVRSCERERMRTSCASVSSISWCSSRELEDVWRKLERCAAALFLPPCASSSSQ